MSPEHIGFKNRTLGIDCSTINVRDRIAPEAWYQVVASAKILQEENDVPFEQGDVVFHPATERLYEVRKVYDNRHRSALGNVELECQSGDIDCILPAGSVLHLTYLVEAHAPYNPNVSYITGDTFEDVMQNLLEAINHHRTE
jgi:hypothetical protein